MTAIGAAQKHRRGRARTAVGRDLHAGHAGEELGHALGPGSGDVFGANVADIGDEIDQRLLRACGGDHDPVEARRLRVYLCSSVPGTRRNERRADESSRIPPGKRMHGDSSA